MASDLTIQVSARTVVRYGLGRIFAAETKRECNGDCDAAQGEAKGHVDDIIRQAHRSQAHCQHEAENGETCDIGYAGTAATG